MKKRELNQQPHQYYTNLKSEVFLYGAHKGKVEKPWETKRHLHHIMFELNLVLEGCQTATLDSVTYSQQTGDLLLIPPMRQHEFQVGSSMPMQYFVMHVQVDDPDFLYLMNEVCQGLYAREDELNRMIRPDVQAIMELLENKASKLAILHKLYEMMHKLEDFFQQQRLERMQAVETLSVQIAKRIEYLIAVPIGDKEAMKADWFAEIASSTGFSGRHCHRVFQKAFGMSPRNYLAAIRQQQAMHLLLNGNESMERISGRLGYGNVQSFIRQFAKWTGMTPGAFRKMKAANTIYTTPIELR